RKTPKEITNGTETRWNCGTVAELNNTSAPTIKEATPAMVSAPWVGALISRMNSTNAVSRKIIPNQLTGKMPNPYVPSDKQTTPKNPATQPPGLESSISRAVVPIDRSVKTIFGSVSSKRNCSMKLILSGSVVALAVRN